MNGCTEVRRSLAEAGHAEARLVPTAPGWVRWSEGFLLHQYNELDVMRARKRRRFLPSDGSGGHQLRLGDVEIMHMHEPGALGERREGGLLAALSRPLRAYLATLQSLRFEVEDRGVLLVVGGQPS